MCEVEGKEEMKKSEIDGCATSPNGRKWKWERKHVKRAADTTYKYQTSKARAVQIQKQKKTNSKVQIHKHKNSIKPPRQELGKGSFHAWGAGPEK